MKQQDPNFNTTAHSAGSSMRICFEVWENADGNSILPHDYQYDNGKPNEPVAAKRSLEIPPNR